MIASTTANMSGKTLKKPLDVDAFIPKYLGEPKHEKSLKEQEQADRAFAERLMALKQL